MYLKVNQDTGSGGMILADNIKVIDLAELQFIENALSARLSEIEKLKKFFNENHQKILWLNTENDKKLKYDII